MKKYFLLFVLALFTTTLFAQSTKNRLVVVDKAGNCQGYVIDRVDSVFFDYIEDNAMIEIMLHDFDVSDPLNPKPIVSFTPSADCVKYRYDVMDKSAADVLVDEYMVAHHFEVNKGAFLNAGTDKQPIEVPTLIKDKMYTIVAMGYDKYNTPGSYQKLDFMLPEEKASVICNVDAAELNSLTITITPNELCKGYYMWLFAEGDAEETWIQWATNLQWKTEGDMVKYLGKDLLKDVTTQTWNELSPGSNYELWVQACNENNEYGDLVKLQVSTAKLGGDGVAEMSIEIGDYGFDKEGIKKIYYQMVKFVPNDQCAAHRDIIMTQGAFKSSYNNDENKLMDYMKSEKNPSYPPFLDDPSWNKYGVNEEKVYIEHETTYMVFSMSKNAKGEWGPLSKASFTTPKKPKK